MRRFVSFIFLSLALLPMTGIACTIADLFASEPGNIFPLLTRTNRLDMVDYYNSGQTVAVPNNLAGESRLISLDSIYLKLQASASKVVEMRMMTAGKDTVIAVIETVMTPVPDSRITFWNTQWQQFVRTGTFFKVPTIDNFITRKMTRELRADLQDAMIFPLIELTFTGEQHDCIQASHGLERFLAPDEFKRFASYLRPTLNYSVKGTKIKPVK